MKIAVLCALLFVATGFVQAEDTPNPVAEPAVKVPPPPPFVEGDKVAPQPEATTIQKDNTTFTEYRVAGRLYMIKVQPKSGPPYYLYDETGEGLQPISGRDNGQHISPPRWVIKTF